MTDFNTPFVEADLRQAANDLDGYNNEMLDLINDEYLQDAKLGKAFKKLQWYFLYAAALYFIVRVLVG